MTASDDRTARVWEAASGKSVAILALRVGELRLRGHRRFVNSAAFSPDARLVVTASGDGTARVWEAASGKSVAILRGHRRSVYSAAFSPDGRLVVTAGSDNTARVWEAASWKSVSVLGGSGLSVGRAAFSPNGRLVVTAGDEARVWETETGRSVAVSARAPRFRPQRRLQPGRQARRDRGQRRRGADLHL